MSAVRKVYAAPMAAASPSVGGWHHATCQIVVIFEAKHLKMLVLPTGSGHRRRKLVVYFLDEPRPGLPPVALGNNFDDRRRSGENKAGLDRTLAYSRPMSMNTPPCKTPNNSIGCTRGSARL